MDKAIEIKRRAQRCILNGDLNGALAEYEKLVAIGDPDPYYCVLLADLLYKMGSAAEAQKRYLEAIEGYSKSGLYKNGIAVCKKLSRLSLAPVEVPRWLAQLYSLDGLGTEAGLAYQQLADVLVKAERIDEARAALQQAIQVSPESARLYERLGELEVLAGDPKAAGDAWSDAAERFERAAQDADVKRCRSRIAQLKLSPASRIQPIVDSNSVAIAPVVVPAPPVWQAPQPEVDAAPEAPAPALSISHGPPSPGTGEPHDESLADDARTPEDVTVEHGFGQDDHVAAAEASFDDAAESTEPVFNGAEAEPDMEPETDTEPEVDAVPLADDDTESAEADAVVARDPVPAEVEPVVAAPLVAIDGDASGLSLAGLDPDEYAVDDVAGSSLAEPGTNGAQEMSLGARLGFDAMSFAQPDEPEPPPSFALDRAQPEPPPSFTLDRAAAAPPPLPFTLERPAAAVPEVDPSHEPPPAPLAPAPPPAPAVFSNTLESAPLPMPSGPPAGHAAPAPVLSPAPAPAPAANGTPAMRTEGAGLGIERFGDASTPALPGLDASSRAGAAYPAAGAAPPETTAVSRR